MKEVSNKRTTWIVILGSFLLVLLMVAGTVWMGWSAQRDTEQAVRSVSLLYLDELAGRRKQVVENNLRSRIDTISVAIELMTEEDLGNAQHLAAYQARMKKLFSLDKFAFVDTDGVIYTSLGTQDNIEEYAFNHATISAPEISLFSPDASRCATRSSPLPTFWRPSTPCSAASAATRVSSINAASTPRSTTITSAIT